MSRIDLHLHTTYSDGSFTPAAVLALAHQAGVSALAITDHDITDGLPEAMEAGRQLGIEVIPGIEISAHCDGDEVHILGYFLDWQDRALGQRIATLRANRHTRNPQIVAKLNELGLDLTYEEVRELAGTESVGRPHIARVLMNKGYVQSAKEAFDRFLAHGKPAFVARELPEPKEAIRWIRDAQGVPVLAHPGWIRETRRSLHDVCADLKGVGLQGMEIHYSTHSRSQTTQYLEIAKRLDLLVTGGSDFHGITKPDIAVGTGRGSLKVPEKLLEHLKQAATAS